MKVYKGLLKDMIEHEGVEKYQNGEMYKKVLRIYKKLIREYYRIAVNITVPKEAIMKEQFKKKKKLTTRANKARTRMKQIKKIIEICRKLDVDIESYMAAQFRLIYPELKKTHPNGIIKLTRLISPLAVERFTQLATGREKRVSMDGTAKIRKKKRIIDIERLMLSSIKTMERRLLVVKEEIELNPDIVNEELIRLLRFKKISKIYIYSSDFVREQGAKTLRIKQKLIQQKLNMKQKGEIDGFKYRYNFNQEVEKYVR